MKVKLSEETEIMVREIAEFALDFDGTKYTAKEIVEEAIVHYRQTFLNRIIEWRNKEKSH